MSRDRDRSYPGGKRFAFSIVDDTDVSTLENIRPVYNRLRQLGFRTTKTVWMRRSPSRNFFRSETMEDAPYAEYVKQLNEAGFEIAFHGASMESSVRQQTQDSLHRFRDMFGYFPRMHVNHAENRDNIYWGADRFEHPVLRAIHRWRVKRLYGRVDQFTGHVPGTPHYWGDLCREHITYARNFCYSEINQLKINPSMPYHSDRKPEVRFWYSALDAPDVAAFNRLLSTSRIERLSRERGTCIVATHFGKGFVENGRLNPRTDDILTRLAERPGWFEPASSILDHLRRENGNRSIRRSERIKLELRWLAFRLGSPGRY